jgi:alkylation response protein AidB-like acyl-CoA dehydrogenase
MSHDPSYADVLARVIETVIAPNAESVDRAGEFPHGNLRALADAGILGLCSAAAVGGGGQGLRQAADVVGALGRVCGSTAMIVTMHYSATAAIEALGPEDLRRSIASGEHLSTLAFSEAGSRSQFWAPTGTAAPAAEGTRLDAQKSWVTAAGDADSYVWSSRPLAGDGPMTLWLVPSDAPGLRVTGEFDGLGLRANGSRPVTADGVVIPAGNRLGDDGAGLDLALTIVLPWFLVCTAALSIGLMLAVTDEATAHLGATRFEHLDRSLAQQAIPRNDLGRMRVTTDAQHALLLDTLTAIETGREDASLRVLEVKAAAGEAALDVTDLAMKVCGGAAFRKELGVERRFRDARAARVMAPTTDALHDFIGRAVTGLPLLGEV